MVIFYTCFKIASTSTVMYTIPNMIIAEIIPITSSILTESLSYFSTVDIAPGTVVTIPLRSKNIRGIVLSTTDAKNLKQNLRKQTFKIRNIIEIHDETLFSPAYLKTINQLKNYYLVNTGKLINITYPSYITKNFDQFCYAVAKPPQYQAQQATNILLQKPYTERILEYKNIIQKNLLEKKSTQVICPTVLDVKKIYDDLVEYFPEQVFELHGKTTSKKLVSTYQYIQTEAVVVVSTPNYIDVPAYDKTTIILEKDSSGYYYRAVAPHIDMRILVEQYTLHAGINMIIADTILRPLRFVKNKKNTPSEIFDDKKISLINIHTKNPKKQTDAERIAELSRTKEFSPLCEDIKTEIQKSIQNNETIFCYVQKKSLAPIMSCRDCGNIATDPETETPYSMYTKHNASGKSENIFMNNKTGQFIPAFDLCQFCNGWRMTPLGVGTSSVSAALGELFPETEIVVIDSFNTKNKTAIDKVLKKDEKNSPGAKIIIGTQLALPYLADKIDSSYIISIDGIFAQMSYTSTMRALYLISQIYESTKNHTWIQSRNVLQAQLPNLENIDYKNFVKKNLEQAKEFTIHPYGTVVKITHTCKKTDSQKTYSLYQKHLANYFPDIRIRPNTKKEFKDIQILLHLNVEQWNINFQDIQIQSLLPFGERDIKIEINPEVF